MKKKEDVYLGGRIRGIRNSLGLDQKEFAMLLKTTVSALSNWENGRNQPKDDKLDKIARLGRTTREELIYGDHEVRMKEVMLQIDDVEEKYFNSVIQYFFKIDEDYPTEEEIIKVYEYVVSREERAKEKKLSQKMLAYNIRQTEELLSSNKLNEKNLQLALKELANASSNYETYFDQSVDVVYEEVLNMID